MNTIMATLGLHLDQQSTANLSAKVLALIAMVAGGTLNVAWALQAGFGIMISAATNDRIKFWAVAIGAVVTYFTSQNTDHTVVPQDGGAGVGSVTPPKVMWLLPVVLGSALLSACASAPVKNVVIGETAAVQAIHVAITAEKAAFEAKALSPAQHTKDLDAFKKVIAAEKALNDALLVWAKTSGQPMPVAVVTAVQALSGILADLQPLVSTNSATATAANTLATALSLLTKGV